MKKDTPVKYNTVPQLQIIPKTKLFPIIIKKIVVNPKKKEPRNSHIALLKQRSGNYPAHGSTT